MTLAIVTAIGHAHEMRGRALLRDFAAYSRSQFVASPPDMPAPVDGLCMRDGVVRCVVEAKVRGGYSLVDVRRMGSTIILSVSKLRALATTGQMLGVPSFFVAEFADGSRWYWQVADANGLPSCDWNVRRSVTKSDSVGGCDVERENGFLSLDHGVCWAAPEEKKHDRIG
jgi:hypothetical protein